MTRYSRSVIPGRSEAAPDPAELDRQVFGAKKRAFPPSAVANDADDEPDFLPPVVDDDEATHLIERSNSDRRNKAKGDRRSVVSERRKSDYAPLPKADRGYRAPEDGKRGPMLLVGALVIVAVFGVVVWNAYREGVKTDGPADPPQLASSGAFKTPGRDMTQATPVPEESAEVLEQLEGSSSVTSTPAKPTPEGHPEPAPVKAAPPAAAKPPVQTAATTPPASKVTAPPPAPLKQSAAPAAKPSVVTTAAIALTPTTPAATPPLAPPAPVKPEAAKPEAVKAAATPAPAVASGYKPAFIASGTWVAQIAAPSTEAGAVAEWDRRAKASPELFSAAERFVIQADVNGKTVYRVRAGSFASKADADAFCAAFKAKGGNCFPAAK